MSIRILLFLQLLMIFHGTLLSYIIQMPPIPGSKEFFTVLSGIMIAIRAWLIILAIENFFICYWEDGSVFLQNLSLRKIRIQWIFFIKLLTSMVLSRSCAWSTSGSSAAGRRRSTRDPVRPSAGHASVEKENFLCSDTENPSMDLARTSVEQAFLDLAHLSAEWVVFST